MTALTDILRRRAERLSARAAVELGGLGTVSVEALPLRECAALYHGTDGARAVLYAACRELQQAGNTLFLERRVPAPDGIMQLLPDEEVLEAARVVLSLSGLPDKAAPAQTGADTGSNGLALPASADRTDKPDEQNLAPDGASAPPVSAALSDSASRMSEPERTPASTDPVPVNPALLVSADETDKNRLDSVQTFGKHFSGIRPDIVQPQAEDPEENRLDSVQEFTELRHTTGQASRETDANGGKGAPFKKTDKNLQALGDFSDVRTQNVVSGENLPSPDEEEENRRAARLHEIESEFSASLHEAASEFFGGESWAAHEIKSESGGAMHEIESEFGRSGAVPLHETKSYFPEIVHETESENGGELHETASELAECVARRLLEGLRRADMVR